jgi:uncharacterized protein with NRDE domain
MYSVFMDIVCLLLYTHLQAVRLGKNLRELVRKHGDDEVEAKDIVERLMSDTTKADKDRLPNTGCDPDWEHGLSSIFIEVQTDQVRKRFCTSSAYTNNILHAMQGTYLNPFT